MLFTSRPASKKPEQYKFVFHHIGKTGGTTFSGILHAIASLKEIKAGFLPANSSRGSLIKTEAGITSYEKILSECEIIYGHCGIKAWREIKDTHKLVTITRDPVQRVTSDYFWRKKHDKKTRSISEEDFLEFVHESNNQNVCCKSILGDTSIRASEKVLREGIETFLRKNTEQILYIGTTNTLKSMIEAFLSHYQCMSIEIEKAKEEKNPLKRIYADKFSDEILKLNQADADFVKWSASTESQHKKNLKSGPEQSKMMAEFRNIGGKNFALVKVKTPEGNFYGKNNINNQAKLNDLPAKTSTARPSTTSEATTQVKSALGSSASPLENVFTRLKALLG